MRYETTRASYKTNLLLWKVLFCFVREFSCCLYSFTFVDKMGFLVHVLIEFKL